MSKDAAPAAVSTIVWLCEWRELNCGRNVNTKCGFANGAAELSTHNKHEVRLYEWLS